MYINCISCSVPAGRFDIFLSAVSSVLSTRLRSMTTVLRKLDK